MFQDSSVMLKARLTELEGGNFHEWKNRLLTYARSQQIAKYIEQELKPPTYSEKEEYEYNDASALSIIHATVNAKNYQIIANCRTARTAYLAL